MKPDLHAQCNPDVTAPVAICKAGLTASLNQNGELTIWASDIDNGSFDACTSVDLFMEENPPSANPPNTPSLDFDTTDIGSQFVVLWVIDEAGNDNQCFTNLTILGYSAQCSPDVTPPTPYCKNGLVAELGSNGEVEIWAQDIDDGSFDNCPGALDFYIEATPASSGPPSTQSLIFDASDIGNNEVAMWVIDQAGIGNFCTVTIEITECQGSTTLACNDEVYVSLDNNGMASIEPEVILEGGPYCYQNMGIDYFNGGGFPGLPAVEVDTSDIGTHVLVVYDSQTGVSCWGTVVIQGGCTPDATPPVAICDAQTFISLGLFEPYTVDAQVFDDGSYDQCGPIDFFIEKELDPVPTLPSTTTITFDTSDVGVHTIALWVVDQAGNENFCTTEVLVESCFVGGLTCNGLQTVGIPSSGSLPVSPDDVLESSPECSIWFGIDFLNGSTPPGMDTIILDTSHIGTTQQVIVYDLITGSSCWGEIEVIDCTNDTIAPTPVCVNGLIVEMGMVVPHEATVWGSDFDEGSFDGCSDVEFRIELGANPSAQAPATESLTFEENEVGNYDVVMWVIDDAGNEDYCITTLEIIAPDCNNDTSPPICTAPADITISKGTVAALGMDLTDQDDLAMYFGQVDAMDNCGIAEILKPIDRSWNSTCGITDLVRKFVVIDSAGNLSQQCRQEINFYNAWEIHLPEDYLPGDPFIDSLEIIEQDSGSLAVTFDDLVFDYNCDGDPDRIIRMWTAINWCDIGIAPNPPIMPIERLDLDGDGTTGDGFEIRNGQDSIALLENGFPTSNLQATGSGVTYMQIIRFNYNDTLDFNISGTVFHDLDENCGLNGMEPSLAGWPVNITGLVTGNTLTTLTDSLGQYSFDLCTIDTLAEVSLDVPFNYGQVCGTTHTVQLIPGISQTVVQDIPVHYDTICPLLWVDVSTPFLRRCFENYYTVNYCNYSNVTIEDVYVEVQLDPFMNFTSSEIPENSLGGNLYTFDIGQLAAGECGDFKIHFELDCAATLGTSHCVDAHIFPDTLCPNQMNWSGANIEVEAVCENDTVILSVKNTGTAAMAGPLGYIVVEDLIMLNGDQFDLAPGEAEIMPGIPANGATYRIEAEQEPGHPFPGNVAAAVEGCNGTNIFGLLNLFPLENPNPFIASDCQQNIGSFDPNDKQAFPTGYGDEHYIKRNTDIDYLIRFQNTGTDTAFKVVIIDELDPALDPSSIRPGAASHNYQFELIDGNTLRFTFDDIMLPDSNINEPASHGFIKFKASQKANLPLGTVIENGAAIYFDFNDPIITNTVFHTLGENFVEVINDTDERAAGLGALRTYPNPSLGDVIFEIPETVTAEAVFVLHNALGKQLVVDSFSAATNTYRFKRGSLAPGVYFYQVEIEGVGMYSGKIILQ